MRTGALALPLLLAPLPALAAERVFSVGSFERVRVDGPFEVRIEAGASPGATASGERQLIERIAVAVNGGTLSVRLGTGGWGETFRADNAAPPVIVLRTPRLNSLAVSAGANVTVNRMAGQRVELSLAGSGRVEAARVDADQLAASLVGAGTITAGGQANRTRLITDGPGTIDASGLLTKDLTVLLTGPGETRARARYTASVTNTGLGKVTVAGDATCTVRSAGGGPVSCGKPAAK
ncbi:head GIN domain-containing protein [Sphingomonas sp. Ag1]|jgi:hypothetical protein|uniref:head GIN domain-containing protein n=1 Tax=Sphingomonas sp. Ag1 TaxID=1642949 RepID=UPI00062130CA|nr:head GIN domain-containing protein [Sphingomonas sp. Ag1]KKI20095.1 hypothetical protein XM50_06580 [Sphingomonas sp. Ag1]